MRVVCALTLVALGPACAPAAPPRDLDLTDVPREKPEVAAPELPSWITQAVYAPLFEVGRDWRFSGEEVLHGPERDPDTDQILVTKRGVSLYCRVASVLPLGDVYAAHVECDRRFDIAVTNSGPSGTFVASRQGLWLYDRLPDTATIAAREPIDMLFAAKPQQRDIKAELPANNRDGKDYEQFHRVQTWQAAPTPGNGTWCSRRTWAEDDVRIAEICLGPGPSFALDITFGEPVSAHLTLAATKSSR